MNLDRYKDILSLPLEYKNVNIVTHLPKPTEFDYSQGYIIRYFLQK